LELKGYVLCERKSKAASRELKKHDRQSAGGGGIETEWWYNYTTQLVFKARIDTAFQQTDTPLSGNLNIKLILCFPG